MLKRCAHRRYGVHEAEGCVGKTGRRIAVAVVTRRLRTEHLEEESGTRGNECDRALGSIDSHRTAVGMVALELRIEP